MSVLKNSAEYKRLIASQEKEADWKKWGPYLSERAWGTVREDYSPYGTAWDYFLHDHARSRAYRWNEDGLAGICDRNQYLCWSLTLWNGLDPILKERLFSLNSLEGNHGEDVKELYYYLDNTPTHSYMKMRYKYPQRAFPYVELVEENGRRGFDDDEYELVDTGVFADDAYFDVLIEFAKADEDDILIKISITNRGAFASSVQILPTIWFRNTWSWGYPSGPMGDVPGKPTLKTIDEKNIHLIHPTLGPYYYYTELPGELLFTENETNQERLFGNPNNTSFVKDAFHQYLIDGDKHAINPAQEGTKAAVLIKKMIPAGETFHLKQRLSANELKKPFADFDTIFATRIREADNYYQALHRETASTEEKDIQRQALAGMLWTKQLYYYDIEQWLQGDPSTISPPGTRINGRNANWHHLNNFDILSMPDKWEYPWYAAWDLAFHCLPLTLVDPVFAKKQLQLLTRVWYLHPSGQLPAYEWAFSDVNPPVHAWAAWQVYNLESELYGNKDQAFLEGVFHKLLLNFTWWVNRKDKDGHDIFQGGFLGLDNISLFDRSADLPLGGHIDQSDGTAWMGFFSLSLMRIALELARDNPVYQDLATKFYEHFLRIAYAMTNCGGKGYSLWDDEDGFFYDILHLPDNSICPLKVRSLVGLMPLLAVEILEPAILEAMPDFARRMHWLTDNKPDLTGNMASIDIPGTGNRIITSILTEERLSSVLRYMLDEDEFLSPYGIRSLSKFHEKNPYYLKVAGKTFSIEYQPAESRNGLFGGNSNWRGPIWYPINYLLIESLKKFYQYCGDTLQVECPTGSGNWMNLLEVAEELSRRLIKIFLPADDGCRPFHGKQEADIIDQDSIQFYEYFHGDTGKGLGASHQTGWTGLIANLIHSKEKNNG